jgi:hypothetical protein
MNNRQLIFRAACWIIEFWSLICGTDIDFQTDVENMREELQFKDHKLSEWENLLRSERDKIKSLENELEVIYTLFFFPFSINWLGLFYYHLHVTRSDIPCIHCHFKLMLVSWILGM